MKIAIIGVGALGSVMGALLWEAGLDPILIERNSQEVDHVRKNGIWVEGVSGSRWVQPRISVDSDATLGTVDLVLVLVKSYDTRAACQTVSKLVSNQSVILTVQNGIGNFEILDEFFPGQVMMGVTTMGAMTLGTGKVRHTGFGPTKIGELDGSLSERVILVRDTLQKMNGGPVEAVDNALGSVWSKLIINACINAPGTLLRLRNGDLPTTEAGLTLIRNVVQECVRLVHAKGIKLIYDDPEAQVIKVCEGTAENLNSMFQDIIACRKTEIDFINGAIACQARAQGLDAPVNETLALLIKALESTNNIRVSN